MGKTYPQKLRALPSPPPALQVQAALHCTPPDAGAHRRGCRAALGAREEARRGGRCIAYPPLAGAAPKGCLHLLSAPLRTRYSNSG
jgi:hypothetical protein